MPGGRALAAFPPYLLVSSAFCELRSFLSCFQFTCYEPVPIGVRPDTPDITGAEQEKRTRMIADCGFQANPTETPGAQASRLPWGRGRLARSSPDRGPTRRVLPAIRNRRTALLWCARITANANTPIFGLNCFLLCRISVRTPAANVRVFRFHCRLSVRFPENA
jgi:hypothetical protein